jgi:hypothetical protein
MVLAPREAMHQPGRQSAERVVDGEDHKDRYAEKDEEGLRG